MSEASGQGNIQVGSITNSVGVAIGHGASVVVNQIVQGLGDLPTHYDGPVRNFFEYYLGTPDRPAPFGGREADLAALDKWLDDANVPRYLLLAAPAGRGKSALLAHWIARLEQRSDSSKVHTVFFPISARFNSNREAVVFPALYARIAHVHGDKATRAADAYEYRNVFMDYVRRPPPDGRRALVVLDGLDEAAGWEAGADLFPTEPPPHLRVVVAARVLAGDLAWLAQLGWDTPGQAQRLLLGGLNVDSVRDVLQRMGDPLDQLAAKPDVVGRLHQLSEGDPVLVGLYILAMRGSGETMTALAPDDLLKLKPGLDSYFDLWFKKQDEIWRSSGEQIDHDAQDALLNVLAVALGPLSKDDVLALAPDELKNSQALKRTVQALNRFIIGDGTTEHGYVFSHPRLDDHFSGRLPNKEWLAWHNRFLKYGRDTLAGLNEGALQPAAAPPYAVQYYGAHLDHERAKAPSAEVYALICESWLRAWEHVDSTLSGFLGDAHRTWGRARSDGGAALGQQIRAALCLSSAASLSASIPVDLLTNCIKAGLLSSRHALVFARSKLDRRERVEALARCSASLPADEQRVILVEALSAAEGIEDTGSRANALLWVAQFLPREAPDLLEQVVNLARKIESDYDQAEVLCAVANRLLPEQQQTVLADALSAIRGIRNDHARARALCAVAARLPPEERQTVLTEVLEVARNSDDMIRSEVLCLLAQGLPPQAGGLAEDGLVAAGAIGDAYLQAIAVRATAERLPPDRRRTVLLDALSAVRTRAGAHSAAALSVLAELLPPDERLSVLAEALSVARGIRDDGERADALYAIAERLPAEAGGIVREVLAAAGAIRDERARAGILCKAARGLPMEKQPGVLLDVIGASRKIEDVQSRLDMLLSALRVADLLPPEQKRAVFKAVQDFVREADNESIGTSVLCAVAERLPSNEQHAVLDEALSAARVIRDESDRAQILSTLAEHLPLDGQRAVLAEALRVVGSIRDAGGAGSPLPAILGHMPPEATDLVAQALNIVQKIGDEQHRTGLLSTVVGHIPPEATDSLTEALNIALGIRNESDRAPTLNWIAERLPPDGGGLYVPVLRATREIRDETARANPLCTIIRRLPPGSTDLLAEALTAAQEIKKDSIRAWVLCTVAERLPMEMKFKVLQEALGTVQKIGDGYSRAINLLTIAEHWPLAEQGALVTEALDAARGIGEEDNRLSVLLSVLEWTQRLPLEEQPAILAKALDFAQGLEKAQDRVLALCAMTKHVSQEKWRELMTVALSTVPAIESERERVLALNAVVECLLPESTDLLSDALETARQIKDAGVRADALCVVAKRLSPKEQYLAEALSAAGQIEDQRSRALGLRAVTKHLPPEATHLLAIALNAAREIDKERYRANALRAVIQRLPPEPMDLLVEALSVARGTKGDDYARARALRALAARLPPDEQLSVMAEALTAASALDGWERTEALADVAQHLPPGAADLQQKILQAAIESRNISLLQYLAPHWAVMCKEDPYVELHALSDTLEAFSKAKRENLLGAIEALLPVIHRLGGEKAVRETAQAIIDTAKWWP